MWAPLTVKSHFSLQRGLSKPEHIVARCKEIGVGAVGLTDLASISGCPTALKGINKAGMKGIAGCEFWICPEDPTIKEVSNLANSRVTVLAPDFDSWKDLVKAYSASASQELMFKRPRLNLAKLAEFSKGKFIVLSGRLCSDLANCIFAEPRMAYSATSLEQAKGMARKGWNDLVFSKIAEYQSLFGKENFFVEIQLNDRLATPASQLVADGLRWAAKKLGVECVATADSHYCKSQDASDQRVLLCSSTDSTMEEAAKKIVGHEDPSLVCFFRSNKFHIPTYDEMREVHTEAELANTLKIAERCSQYEIGGKPMFPSIVGPKGEKPEDMLKELCVKGWKKRIESSKKIPKEKIPVYAERIKKELGVINKAQLASYFLIVEDYVSYARNVLGSMIGPGRGSAAGCLVSYLIGITGVDPIEFDLLFERFYNDGRNSPGRVAIPDVDIDFEARFRQAVIQYLRDKYGEDKVCQMSTFSRMQGRAAIKDVLRAHARCGHDEANRICEFIPDESEISDQLQEMREETGEASIIQWALENNPDQLKEWCFINAQGELEGPLAIDFAQAIRLEGTKRNMGKHASGVIISSEPLADLCPMFVDKTTGHAVIGVDMKDAELLGFIKFDILGLQSLDRISAATRMIRGGSRA